MYCKISLKHGKKKEKHHGGWLENIWDITNMTRHFEVPQIYRDYRDVRYKLEALFQNYLVTKEDEAMIKAMMVVI